MKKYLFLLFLFMLYLMLFFSNNDVEPALLYDNRNDENVSGVIAKFDDGINSNELTNILNKYDKEYFIYKVNVSGENIDVSCTMINDCISQIYEQNSNLFNTLYVTNGFSIKRVYFLAYTSEVMPFLNENNITFDLK